MSSRTMSASLFTTVALAALGIAVWIGIASAPRPAASGEAVALAGADVAGQVAARRVPERVDGGPAAGAADPGLDAVDASGPAAGAADPGLDAVDASGPEPDGARSTLALAAAESESAPEPAAAEPAPAPVQAAAEPAPAPVQAAPEPSPAINGLHVLCPLPDGGAAHLLLTSETYYRAETSAEIMRLTDIFGPPVTSIDPSVLPPKSAISVTEALNAVAAG